MGKQQSTVVKFSESAYEWTDPNGKHWMVDTYWSNVDGRQECIGLTLRSFGIIDEKRKLARPVREAEGVHPLRAEVLRGALTMGVIDQRRSKVVEFLDYAANADHMKRYQTAEVATLRAEFAAGPRRRITGADGAPMPTADALAEVARVYREAWQVGANPTAAVADVFTLSRSAAAKRVARAREAGLLPPTTRGQARGGKGATS